MKNDYSMYNYYKGEEENPFDAEKQNSEFMFWGYELHFDKLYNNGNYKKDTFKHIAVGQETEVRNVLKSHPADKERLFKSWLYHLLWDQLPSKWGLSFESLRKAYFK